MEHAAEGISDRVTDNVSCIHQYSPLSSSFVWQCKCERSWLCVIMQVRSCFQCGVPHVIVFKLFAGRSGHSTHIHTETHRTGK